MATSYLKPTSPRGIIKIPNNNIDLSVIRNNQTGIPEKIHFFGLDIDDLKGSKKIRSDAKIILEIFNDVDLNRFELGKISAPNPLKDEPISLKGTKSSIYFSIFVVEDIHVRASNENIKIRDDFRDSSRLGLITFEPDNEMGELTWHLDPVDGSREPIIKVNNDPEIGILQELNSGNPTYRGLIVMNAIEQYLRILSKSADEEWTKNWKLYLSEKGVEDCPEEESEIDLWIQGALKIISDDLSLFTKMKNHMRPT